MNTGLIDNIANAVLYEGYILYPYRPSLKNCRRTMFGAVYPRAYAEGTPERSTMQTEILIEGDASAAVEVQVRFLHWTERLVGRTVSLAADGGTPDFTFTDLLEIDGRDYPRWEEAVERRVEVGPRNVADLAATPLHVPFCFAAAHEIEWLEPPGEQRAAFVRQRRSLEGVIEVSTRPLAEGLWGLCVRIENLSDCAAASSAGEAQMAALHSTHTILGVSGGHFVSQMDPPEAWREIAAGLSNDGTWPVLAGDESRRNLVLSSPIILYDFPQVAESAGDHFDSTEIDVMLGLRIATMTDDEKQRMRAVDEHARQLLCRTEEQPEEAFRNLQGTLRTLGRVGAAVSEVTTDE